MWWIPFGYIVTVLGLTFAKYHTELQLDIVDVPISYRYVFYVAPFLLARTRYKFRVFIYIFMCISCVLYYYIFEDSVVTQVQLMLLLYSAYDIFRYGVYYEALIHRTQTIESAKTKFPYHGIVSNFGNVLQLRFRKLSKIVPEYVLLYTSMVFLLFGGLTCSSLWEDVQSHPLFCNEVKHRRLQIQSLIVLCATLCKNIASNSVHSYIESTTYIYDFIPLVVTLVLVTMSKNIFKLHYRVYSIICPILSLMCSIVLVVTDDRTPSYLANSLYALFQTMHYTIFDPIRLVLYVAHYNDVSSTYCSYDILLIGLSHLLCEVSKGYEKYIILPVHVLWIGLAHYSRKYYIKDIERLECIRMLESG